MAKNILKNDVRIEFSKNIMFTYSNMPGNIFSGDLRKLEKVINYFQGNPENGDFPKVVRATVYNNDVLRYLLQEGLLPEERSDLKMKDNCSILDDVELYYALK